MKTKLLIIIIITFFSAAAFAQAGVLDSTFGGDGIVIDSIGSEGAAVNAIAIQSDGKIIAVGQNVVNDTSSDFVVVRHNNDGSYDSSFGTNGVVITSVGSQKDTATSVAIAADGKIVVAGWTQVSNYYYDSRIKVVRYNTDGTLDSSFGVNGIVTYLFWNGVQAHEVVIQPDGKIVVTGGIFSPTWEFYFLLVRFNVDGTLDTDFGLNGRVVTYISNYARATSIAIQTDGKIIAAGGSFDFNDQIQSYALVRYDTDGTLDENFGTGGIVLTPFSPSDCSINSLAIQADQKIIAGGFSDGAIDGFKLIRYKTDGKVDSTFGNNGIVATLFEGSSASYLTSISLQTDGKIVATGQVDTVGGELFGTCRYNIDGGLDSSFGTNGETTFDAATFDFSSSVAIQTDGKIVVGGYAIDNSYMDFILIRYLSSLDLGNIEFSSINSSIYIYPNPCESEIAISNLPSDINQFQLTIISEIGQQYERGLLNRSELPSINISDLPQGMYEMVLQDKQKKWLGKFVKL